MKNDPKVFISYAWESAAHQDRVLGLADWLEVNGVEVIFDQYDPNPIQPWPHWMEEGLNTADFVLCICTEAYKERVEKKSPAQTGLGLQWEGTIIYNNIASQTDSANKYQVVQFDNQDIASIPSGLSGNNRHVIGTFDLSDNGLENLYRIITDQPKAQRPTRGSIQRLQQVERLVVPRSGLDIETSPLVLSSATSQLPSQVSHIVSPSKKRVQAKAGRGTYLERLAISTFRLATEAFSLDDYVESASLAMRAHELDNSDYTYKRLVAQALYRLHDYEQAIYWLEMCLAADNSDTGCWYKLMVAKSITQGGGDILDSVVARFESTPKQLEDYADFASALSDLGQYTKAISVLQEAHQRFGSDHETQAQLAVYHWYDGDTATAVELLEKVPKSEYNATTWSNYGVGLAELGRFGLAIEALNKALRDGRRYQFAWYALAEIYALMGDAEPAVEKLRSLLGRRSVHLQRLSGERNFDSIRNTPVFQEFMKEVADVHSQ